MNDLLVNNQPSSPARANNNRGPGVMGWKVVGLYLKGKTRKEIAAECGISYMSVCKILNHPDAVAMTGQYLKSIREDISMLIPKVYERIREQLDSGDPKIVAKAIELWHNMEKGQIDHSSNNVHLTAEDIVINILNHNG